MIEINLEILNDLLVCDAEKGLLYWKERSPKYFKNEKRVSNWNGRFAGKPAFTTLKPEGYLQGTLFRKHHYAHRIIWWMTNGIEPSEIDHRNGIRSDNRIENLKNVSSSENSKNLKLMKHNTSSCSGVYLNRKQDVWVAQITIDKKRKFLGSFKDKKDAINARKEAESYYGFSDRHGTI
jgi:hypothetical protein